MSELSERANLRCPMHARLEKRDATGVIFEVVEIDDDGKGTTRGRVTYRRAGEPTESYAALPYVPAPEQEDPKP